MSAWNDKQNRVRTNKEVSQLISQDMLEKRRYYVLGIIDTVLFLVENKLAFRRNWTDDRLEDGHFANLLQNFVSIKVYHFTLHHIFTSTNLSFKKTQK